jgi:hypothetical protein
MPSTKTPRLTNFESRITNMFSPNAPKIVNPDGTTSSHKMAWGTVDNFAIAYPTIIQLADGTLKELDQKAAAEYALRTGEYKKFANAKDAEAYANGGYKPKQ